MIPKSLGCLYFTRFGKDFLNISSTWDRLGFVPIKTHHFVEYFCLQINSNTTTAFNPGQIVMTGVSSDVASKLRATVQPSIGVIDVAAKLKVDAHLYWLLLLHFLML